jgi:hypothetical protein
LLNHTMDYTVNQAENQAKYALKSHIKKS